ncbi:hypothetical protein K8I61_08640 [bacterium]|nr:hypothetical protein [bacterium]
MRRFLGIAAIALALIVPCGARASDFGQLKGQVVTIDHDAAPRGTGVFRAGAAEADITPRIRTFVDANGNGVHDGGDPKKAYDIGERVVEFEEGTIFVGNGNGAATHVHAPLYASALVVEDPDTGVRVGYVSSDLYLLLQHDTDAIRAMIGPSARVDHVVVAPTHNHMGPDTLGIASLGVVGAGPILAALFEGASIESGVNAVWFDRMAKTTAMLVEQAAANLKPATLRVGKSHFSFGMTDEREPKIIDDELLTIALDGADGKPIATLIQGNCHPESVLLFADPKYTLIDDLDAIPAETRAAWGHIITPGFPGWVRNHVREKRGGVPLYFSGALGAMVTNISTKIWDPEAHPEYPASADPASVPEAIKIPPDFRMAPIQGREMAKAALASLADARAADRPDVSFRRKDVLLPLDNPLFRLVAGLGILGRHRGTMYDDKGRPDARTGHCAKGVCVPGVDIPKGRNLRTEVSVVNIGPAQLINIPAEVVGEISLGKPADFDTNVPRYFPNDAKHHAAGADYKLMYPPLKKLATRRYPAVIGLAQSDMGYVIPASDFDPPHDLWVPPFSAWWICFDSSSNPHYEESNTASRLMEERLVGGLVELLKAERDRPADQSRDR